MTSVVSPSRALDPLPHPAALGDLDPSPPAAFTIRREDIEWRLVTPDTLEIGVTIGNLSDRVTPPTHAIIRSAAFGAFLPQRPLTVLRVPPIAPRDRVTLTTVVPVAALAQAETAAGGGPAQGVNRVAVALSDDVERREREFEGMLRAIREPDMQTAAWRLAAARGPLPPILLMALAKHLERLGSTDPTTEYWSGNLHICVGGSAAERHRAQGVVVRRGITTVVPFDVGDSRPDAYAFLLDGEASGWEPALIDRYSGRGALPFARGRLSDSCPEWVEIDRAFLHLTVRPPESAAPGRSELHIQRRSSGQTAVVEFELDPR